MNLLMGLLYINKNVQIVNGKFARKSALGKSQVIANWSKEKIKNAVIGYQEKTYGRSMKGLMRSEVKSLNEEQVDALANYISNLNH